MKKIQFGTSELTVAAIILGCLRINTAENPNEIIETAYENGINFFDHADIYGSGECETIFGKVIKESSIKREDIIIQSKCGIRKGFFDFSKEHIITSVEGSLKRLNVDYLDVLLLHRPDTLVEPEEVAAAFDQLEEQGKVNYFGVSNQKPMQIELLKKSVKQPLHVNQLQFGIKHTGMVDQGIHVNMKDDASNDRDGSVLDYSRVNEMTIQAWSPFQYGFFEGVFLGNDNFPELNKVMEQIAETHSISTTTLASAWILRHPANMQVIAGTMNQQRIKEIAISSSIELSREEWYEIYRAAGNCLP